MEEAILISLTGSIDNSQSIQANIIYGGFHTELAWALKILDGNLLYDDDSTQPLIYINNPLALEIIDRHEKKG